MSVIPATVRLGGARRRRSTGAGVGFVRLCGALVLGTGLATVLWSLFLPWLASGPATRTSFQLMGLAARYPFFDAWWYRLAPEVWPFWGPAVAVTALLLVLRLRRCAAVLGLLVGACATTVGVLVLVHGSGRTVGGIRLVELGPATLAIGGGLALIGAVVLFLPSATRLVRSSGP